MSYLIDNAERIEAAAGVLREELEQFMIDYRISIPAVDLEEEEYDVLYCRRRITPAQQRLLDGLEIVRRQADHIEWSSLHTMRTVTAADKRVSA